jgi:hypothetical protein
MTATAHAHVHRRVVPAFPRADAESNEEAIAMKCSRCRRPIEGAAFTIKITGIGASTSAAVCAWCAAAIRASVRPGILARRAVGVMSLGPVRPAGNPKP